MKPLNRSLLSLRLNVFGIACFFQRSLCPFARMHFWTPENLEAADRFLGNPFVDYSSAWKDQKGPGH